MTDAGCWEWQQKSRAPGGYGVVWMGGRLWRAHRAVWTLMVGEIPEGLELDHKVCNNPPCVNPLHLEPVTGRVNVRRAPRHNANKTHCPARHPYSPENTIVIARRGGLERRCRECYNGRRRKNPS